MLITVSTPRRRPGILDTHVGVSHMDQQDRRPALSVTERLHHANHLDTTKNRTHGPRRHESAGVTLGGELASTDLWWRDCVLDLSTAPAQAIS